MAKAEQIDRHTRAAHKGSAKAYLKAWLARLRRRAEKRSPEDAPGQVREWTRGYSS